jgi:hypothetical protein
MPTLDQLTGTDLFNAARVSLSLITTLEIFSVAFEINPDQTQAAFVYQGVRYFVDILDNTYHKEGSPSDSHDGYDLWLMVNQQYAVDSPDAQAAFVQSALLNVDPQIGPGNWQAALAL